MSKNNDNQQIHDADDLRKYFAMIPHMADDDLDPYEYRLYGHYKRVCGEDGGTCWERTPTTAEKSQMSAGQVSKKRKSLAEKGYIRLEGGKGTETIKVTLLPLWEENIKRYVEGSVHTVNASVHTVNSQRSSGETKKNPPKKNQEESPPTPPSGESDSANSVNGKKPKTGRTKEDLDALYNMICKGSFNKDHSEIDKPQRGRVLAIRKALLKAMPDVTAEELKQAYVLYAQKNPEALEDATRRLKSETKVPDWLQMAIDEGMVPTRQVSADPRASQKWQANAEIYRAYADAFSDRWSDAEILAQDFSGIEAWWYHTGQYEQGDGE